jgi:DNA-binding LacI/PurR family transcriptional regulator
VRAAGLDPLVVGGGGDPSAGGAPDTTEADGYRLAAALLDAHPEVTAVVAANDPMAMGAMGAAAERGLRTPADLSVVGYDDSPLASAALLRLTTVDARNDEVGRIAARALLDRIERGPRAAGESPDEVTVEPRLVVRASTGVPRR